VAGEIREATKRLKERERAAALVRPEHFTDAGKESLIAAARAIYSGTDLDFAEASEAATEHAEEVVDGLLRYGFGALAPMVAGTYAEGLITGLLIAEAREREAARS
jgi:hypothetical protein